MEALITRANAIQPIKQKQRSARYIRGKRNGETKRDFESQDATLSSVSRRTSIPSSLLPISSAVGKDKGKQKATPDHHPHIVDRKLKARLNSQKALVIQRNAQLADAELLLPGVPGLMEATDPLERTWRVTQNELLDNEGVGLEARAGRKEIVLDETGTGAYRLRWTRNGRHLAIASRRGFIANTDWMAGKVIKEIRVGETCRDITYLHSHHHVAVAQKRHVFVYDQDLVELHRLSALIEPAFLEFLPYHWLLVSAGLPGILSYLDTSTGTIMAQHRPKLGPPTALAQNVHNAVIYWGAGNGTVSLWTPSSPAPHVRLLAHLGPIIALSVDPSNGGRYLATSGMDGYVKIWDGRNLGTPTREWKPRHGTANALEWSQRGILAVASAGLVNMYTPPAIHTSPIIQKEISHNTYPGHTTPVLPPLYITHPLPVGSKPATCVKWQPFMDVLGIGHGKGLSSILVPGSGEPNFDSGEADPFETSKRRAEREVRGLLDKIHPDMITLNPNDIGGLISAPKLKYAGDDKGAPIQSSDMPFRSLPRLERLRILGKADETELVRSDEEIEGEDEQAKRVYVEKREKMKMRGKNKALSRYLRKKRKNVIDASVLALRAKVEKQKKDRRKELAEEKKIAHVAGANEDRPSALDRFRRWK